MWSFHVCRCHSARHENILWGVIRFFGVLYVSIWHHPALPVMQSHTSKQDSQIKSLQAERASLAAQLEDMQANLQIATSLVDQQVSMKIKMSLVCHGTAPTPPACLAKIIEVSLVLSVAAHTHVHTSPWSHICSVCTGNSNSGDSGRYASTCRASEPATGSS